jgi:excisionase family DNA binding protein
MYICCINLNTAAMKTNHINRQRPSELSRRINVLEEQIRLLMSKKLDYPDSGDVCRQLNVSKRELAYFRESGELPFIKLGKKILFDPADIRHFLASRKIFKDSQS